MCGRIMGAPDYVYYFFFGGVCMCGGGKDGDVGLL